MIFYGEALKTVTVTSPRMVEVLANKTRQEKNDLENMQERKKMFSVEASMADYRAHSGNVRIPLTRERVLTNNCCTKEGGNPICD